MGKTETLPDWGGTVKAPIVGFMEKHRAEYEEEGRGGCRMIHPEKYIPYLHFAWEGEEEIHTFGVPMENWAVLKRHGKTITIAERRARLHQMMEAFQFGAPLEFRVERPRSGKKPFFRLHRQGLPEPPPPMSKEEAKKLFSAPRSPIKKRVSKKAETKAETKSKNGNKK